MSLAFILYVRNFVAARSHLWKCCPVNWKCGPKSNFTACHGLGCECVASGQDIEMLPLNQEKTSKKVIEGVILYCQCGHGGCLAVNTIRCRDITDWVVDGSVFDSTDETINSKCRKLSNGILDDVGPMWWWKCRSGVLVSDAFWPTTSSFHAPTYHTHSGVLTVAIQSSRHFSTIDHLRICQVRRYYTTRWA